MKKNLIPKQRMLVRDVAPVLMAGMMEDATINTIGLHYAALKAIAAAEILIEKISEYEQKVKK